MERISYESPTCQALGFQKFQKEWDKWSMIMKSEPVTLSHMDWWKDRYYELDFMVLKSFLSDIGYEELVLQTREKIEDLEEIHGEMELFRVKIASNNL